MKCTKRAFATRAGSSGCEKVKFCENQDEYSTPSCEDSDSPQNLLRTSCPIFRAPDSPGRKLPKFFTKHVMKVAQTLVNKQARAVLRILHNVKILTHRSNFFCATAPPAPQTSPACIKLSQHSNSTSFHDGRKQKLKESWRDLAGMLKTAASTSTTTLLLHQPMMAQACHNIAY